MQDEQQFIEGRGDQERQEDGGAREEPFNDVILDVPQLRVDEIQLQVERLNARVSLDATVARELVRIRAGVDVDLGGVDLSIKGVEAEAHLRVKLSNVVRIVEEALATLREHPEIVGLVPAAAAAAEETGGRGLGGVTRHLANDLQATGKAKLLQTTAGRTLSKAKRRLTQVTHRIPGIGNGKSAEAEREDARGGEHNGPAGS